MAKRLNESGRLVFGSCFIAKTILIIQLILALFGCLLKVIGDDARFDYGDERSLSARRMRGRNPFPFKAWSAYLEPW
jgi:hypothetical protein